jgi:hypothetical protein
MRTSGAGLAAAACAAVLTACGSTSASAPSQAADRQWEANAADVIGELRRDVDLATGGDDTLASARRTLRDTSSLYTLVVAYTDFGGCGHMVTAIGAPAPPRFGAVRRALKAACTRFERAAALFTQATTAQNPRALRGATRLVVSALPLLARAEAALGTRS